MIAFTGSVNGKKTTSGSSGILNRLCIKNTAKEYLDKNWTPLNPLTFFLLEHNSNNASDPVRMNGNSYHKKKGYPLIYA